MTHRRNDVWLDPKHARCEPLAAGCDQKMRCGRYLARIDGSPLGDYSLPPDFPVPFWVPQCHEWLPVERPPASTPVGPRTHPPLGEPT